MIILEREGIEEVVSMMNSCNILNASMPQRVIPRGRTKRENDTVDNLFGDVSSITLMSNDQ